MYAILNDQGMETGGGIRTGEFLGAFDLRGIGHVIVVKGVRGEEWR